MGKESGSVPGAVYVLESPRFDIENDAELKFDLFRLSARPKIDVSPRVFAEARLRGHRSQKSSLTDSVLFSLPQSGVARLRR